MALLRIWLLASELQLRHNNLAEADACLSEARNLSPMSYHLMHARGRLHEARAEVMAHESASVQAGLLEQARQCYEVWGLETFIVDEIDHFEGNLSPMSYHLMHARRRLKEARAEVMAHESERLDHIEQARQCYEVGALYSISLDGMDHSELATNKQYCLFTLAERAGRVPVARGLAVGAGARAALGADGGAPSLGAEAQDGRAHRPLQRGALGPARKGQGGARQRDAREGQ